MSANLQRFIRDENGATAIEYGLICLLISIAIIAILGALGTNLNSNFSKVNSGFAAH